MNDWDRIVLIEFNWVNIREVFIEKRILSFGFGVVELSMIRD